MTQEEMDFAAHQLMTNMNKSSPAKDARYSNSNSSSSNNASPRRNWKSWSLVISLLRSIAQQWKKSSLPSISCDHQFLFWSTSFKVQYFLMYFIRQDLRVVIKSTRDSVSNEWKSFWLRSSSFARKRSWFFRSSLLFYFIGCDCGSRFKSKLDWN